MSARHTHNSDGYTAAAMAMLAPTIQKKEVETEDRKSTIRHDIKKVIDTKMLKQSSNIDLTSTESFLFLLKVLMEKVRHEKRQESSRKQMKKEGSNVLEDGYKDSQRRYMSHKSIHITDTFLFAKGKPCQWIYNDDDTGEIEINSRVSKLTIPEFVAVIKYRASRFHGRKGETIKKSKVATVWFLETNDVISNILVDEDELVEMLKGYPNEIVLLQPYCVGIPLKGDTGVFEHRYLVKMQYDMYDTLKREVRHETYELVDLRTTSHTATFMDVEPSIFDTEKDITRLVISEDFRCGALKRMTESILSIFSNYMSLRLSGITIQCAFDASGTPFLVAARNIILESAPSAYVFARDAMLFENNHAPEVSSSDFLRQRRQAIVGMVKGQRQVVGGTGGGITGGGNTQGIRARGEGKGKTSNGEGGMQSLLKFLGGDNKKAPATNEEAEGEEGDANVNIAGPEVGWNLRRKDRKKVEQEEATELMRHENNKHPGHSSHLASSLVATKKPFRPLSASLYVGHLKDKEDTQNSAGELAMSITSLSKTSNVNLLIEEDALLKQRDAPKRFMQLTESSKGQVHASHYHAQLISTNQEVQNMNGNDLAMSMSLTPSSSSDVIMKRPLTAPPRSQGLVDSAGSEVVMQKKKFSLYDPKRHNSAFLRKLPTLTRISAVGDMGGNAARLGGFPNDQTNQQQSQMRCWGSFCQDPSTSIAQNPMNGSTSNLVSLRSLAYAKAEIKLVYDGDDEAARADFGQLDPNGSIQFYNNFARRFLQKVNAKCSQKSENTMFHNIPFADHTTWDNFNAVSRRLIYDEAIAGYQPSTLYYCVPSCKTCCKYLNCLDKLRNEMVLHHSSFHPLVHAGGRKRVSKVSASLYPSEKKGNTFALHAQQQPQQQFDTQGSLDISSLEGLKIGIAESVDGDGSAEIIGLGLLSIDADEGRAEEEGDAQGEDVGAEIDKDRRDDDEEEEEEIERYDDDLINRNKKNRIGRIGRPNRTRSPVASKPRKKLWEPKSPPVIDTIRTKTSKTTATWVNLLSSHNAKERKSREKEVDNNANLEESLPLSVSISLQIQKVYGGGASSENIKKASPRKKKTRKKE